MPKRNEYPWIVAWGRMLGSYPYYIDQQVAQARHDGAPNTAIYKDSTGTWQTTDDITSELTRHRLGLPPLNKETRDD